MDWLFLRGVDVDVRLTCTMHRPFWLVLVPNRKEVGPPVALSWSATHNEAKGSTNGARRGCKDHPWPRAVLIPPPNHTHMPHYLCMYYKCI